MSGCVACGGELVAYGPYRYKSEVFRTVYSDGNIYECGACALRQVRVDAIDQEGLNAYYRTLYREIAGIGGTDSMFIYRPRAEGLAALAKEHCRGEVKRIFEVGAGHGINLAALGRAYPDAELFTDEVDETVSLPDRIRRASLADGPFELVVMSHVLEHFSDPIDFVGRAGTALAPGGVLIIEVPNDTVGELATQPFHEPHLTFYERSSLKGLLERRLQVREAFTVGPPPRAATGRASLTEQLKGIARQTPILRPFLNARRAGVKIDLTTKQEGGRYLRAVAGRG